MNEAFPETPLEAAREMWLADREAKAQVDELKALRAAYPHLVKAKRLTYARAFLQAQGPEYFRKQTAELAVADAAFQLDTCDQQIEACKDEIRRLGKLSEDLRAINSNLKEELRTLGSTYDGHP